MPAPVAVGHYKLLEEIGAGGMGEVFRAQDTVLGRTVAVKRLRSEVFADPQRRARFLQEARATSALDHPNIVTIHDLLQHDGADFLVMEFVPGETLKSVLTRGALPLRKALPIAVQIASALEAAHRAGIIHRDLKPSNVMLTESGTAKVLDFGLAKILPARLQQDEPTATAPAQQTSDGVVLGTAAYMSPEQAEGAKVDHRSDIFSFGALLYEMVTGRQAFRGKSWTSTIAAILTREPPAIAQPGEVTPEVDRLIRLCLKKDPQRRFQHIDDVKVLLQQLIEAPLAPEIPNRRVRSGVLVLAAGLVCVALAAAGAWWWRGTLSPPADWQHGRLTQLTRDSGLTTNPHLSADGKMIVYASDRAEPGNLDIWVQQVDGGSAARLTTDPAADHLPKFFPSGTHILFRSERAGGGLYVMPALGGPAKLLVPGGRQAVASPDGRFVLYGVGTSGDFRRSRLYVIPAEGGTPKQVAAHFTSAVSGIWSPDSRSILFGGINANDQADWWLTTPDGAEPVPTNTLQRRSPYAGLGAPDSWSSDGKWIYTTGVRGDAPNIWRVPWDASRRRTGQPQRVTFGAGEVQITAAQTLLAFFSGRQSSSIWSFPLDANHGVVSGAPERLTPGVAAQLRSDLSVDGKTIVFLSVQDGQPDVWVRNLTTGAERNLTANSAFENQPKLSRDGRRVAYMVVEDRKYVLYVSAVDGGVPARICGDCGWPLNWTPDDSAILFQKGPLPEASIWLLHLATGQTRPIIHEPGRPFWAARLSPDGAWVAFKEDLDLNTTRLYVAPVLLDAPTPRDRWIPVTDGKVWDDLPRWSPDGRLLYFLSRRDGMNCFWAVRLDPATRRPVGEAFAALHLHQIRLMTMPDIRFMELAVGPGRLVFPGYEVTGNLWLVRPD